MSTNRESTGGLLGLLGLGMVVRCGLPVLLGAGIAIGAAGIVAGSSLLLVAGAARGASGWRRRQATRSDGTAEPANQTADTPASRPASMAHDPLSRPRPPRRPIGSSSPPSPSRRAQPAQGTRATPFVRSRTDLVLHFARRSSRTRAAAGVPSSQATAQPIGVLSCSSSAIVGLAPRSRRCSTIVGLWN